jgi:hypothetical protein
MLPNLVGTVPAEVPGLFQDLLPMRVYVLVLNGPTCKMGMGRHLAHQKPHLTSDIDEPRYRQGGMVGSLIIT